MSAGQAVVTAEPWATYGYRVEAARAVTPFVREVVMAPSRSALRHTPGQYVMLDVLQPGSVERAYSVANAPRPDGRIHLLVTRYDHGRTSSWVHDRLRRDDRVLLTGPFGTLVTDPTHDGPVLLLAAGAGIAPVAAIAEDLLARQPDRPVLLCFSARTRDHAIWKERFEELAHEHSQLRYVCTLTRDREAQLSTHLPDLLPGLVEHLRGWEVLIAGSEGFVRDCRAAARALGADATSVRTEEFFADPVPWTTAPPRVTCGSAAPRVAPGLAIPRVDPVAGAPAVTAGGRR